jgi:hypothetical protein
MDKAGIANRLSRAGLRNAAEAYREEVRRRILRGQEKRDRDAASEGAWGEMWDLFRPLVEKCEASKAGGTEDASAPLLGCETDLEQFLDPHYTEQDPGKWLRDGLIWVASEIRRVVVDSEEGTTVVLSRAKTPPPTAWAVFVLESFARKPPEKRGELITRVLPFAQRSHEAPENPEPEDGFLEGLG